MPETGYRKVIQKWRITMSAHLDGQSAVCKRVSDEKSNQRHSIANCRHLAQLRLLQLWGLTMASHSAEARPATVC